MAKKKQKLDFGNIAMKTVGLMGGSIGGKVVTNKLFPNMNPLISGGITLAGGAVLGVMAKGNPLLEAVGDGLIASGASTVVGKFIPGIGELDSMTGLNESTVGAEYDTVGDDIYDDMSGVGSENASVVGSTSDYTDESDY